jgi:hypothetical protein
MAGRRHDAVIEHLQERNPSIRTGGFKRALLDQFEEQTGESIKADVAWLRIIPDAYEVSDGLVVAYEVEDAHRVDNAKMDLYARLWNGMDAAEVLEFRLVILDIRGGRLEPDLRAWWLGIE